MTNIFDAFESFIRDADKVADKVIPYILDAELVAWDECHKVYIAMDTEQAEWFRDNDYTVVEGTAAEMLDAVKGWWAASCFLRFIQAVYTDPSKGFVNVIPQFANEDD